MLGDAEAHASIAISDRERAKAFYGDTLGLKLEMEAAPGMTYKAGNSYVEVYQSEFAGSAKNTVAMFMVKDLDGVMSDLRGKGVEFLEYDMPEIKTENGVATMGEGRGCWFKDPDGNILSLVQLA